MSMPCVEGIKPLMLMDTPTPLALDREGLSRESKHLVCRYIEAAIDYLAPDIRESLDQKFQSLAETWRRETAHFSSITQIAMHPAYQHIIGFGQEAIPLILRELQKNPDQWFWALKAISGVDPVPQSERGRVRNMAEIWLRWGKEEGHII